MRPMKAIDQSMLYRTTGDLTLRKDKEYVFEPKIDGVRAYIVFDDEGDATLQVATSGRTVQHDLVSHLSNPRLADTIIDGELTIMGKSLGTLVGMLNATKRREGLKDARLYAFDLPRAIGSDNTRVPLRERVQGLRMVVEHLDDDFVQMVPQRTCTKAGELTSFISSVKDAGFEGFMAKEADSIYTDGRSKSWIKVKWISSIDCFVVGYEPGESGYTNMVGSLQMAVYDEDGNEVEVCSHGVFDLALRRELTAEDGSLDKRWYGQVMEVAYQSSGTDMRLRHPRLLRLRPDRTPESCRIDQLMS